jgi:hypothetical protein
MACKETVRQSTNYMTFHHTIGCFVRRDQPVEADLSANRGERRRENQPDYILSKPQTRPNNRDHFTIAGLLFSADPSKRQ